MNCVCSIEYFTSYKIVLLDKTEIFNEVLVSLKLIFIKILFLNYYISICEFIIIIIISRQ